jgi:hypothetical protein
VQDYFDKAAEYRDEVEGGTGKLGAAAPIRGHVRA